MVHNANIVRSLNIISFVYSTRHFVAMEHHLVFIILVIFFMLSLFALTNLIDYLVLLVGQTDDFFLV